MSIKACFTCALFISMGHLSWVTAQGRIPANPEIINILVAAPYAPLAQQQLEILNRRLEASPFFEKMRLTAVVSQEVPDISLLESLARSHGASLAISGNEDRWLAVYGLRNEHLPLSSMVLPAQTEVGDAWIHPFIEAFSALQCGAFLEAFTILETVLEKCDEPTRQNLTSWTALSANLNGEAEEAVLKLRQLLEDAGALHRGLRGTAASLLGSLLINQYLASGEGLEEAEQLLLDAYNDLRGWAKKSAQRTWDLTRQQIILSRYYATRAEQGDLQRALAFLGEADELLDRETAPLSSALCYADMGLIHLRLFRDGVQRQQNRLDADHRLQQAEEIFEDLQMKAYAESIEKIRRFFHTEF